jgi:hypothetical protein
MIARVRKVTRRRERGNMIARVRKGKGKKEEGKYDW